MKKIIIGCLLVVGLTLFFSGISQGQDVEGKMTLMNFDKGEKPSSSNCSLSKENALEGKKYTVKVTVKEGSSAGFVLISKESNLLQGKRGNWKDYDTLNIKYLNEFNVPIRGSLLIGDEGSASEWNGNYAGPAAVLLPGDHTLSIDITTLEGWRSERGLDLGKMRIVMCYFTKKMDVGGVIYVQDVYVAKEGGGKEEVKASTPSVTGRDIYLLKIHKGELFNDRSRVKTTLSRKHTKEKKYSMKISYTGGGCGWAGEMNGIRPIWKEYSKVSFYVYNASDKEEKIWFVIKGAKMERPNAPINTCSTLCKLPPEGSVQTIDLTKAICDDGKTPLDYSRVFIWNFMNKLDTTFTIYVSEIKLLR